MLYLELYRDLFKQEYAPQSEASLINFQTLLLLEIALLMGCDLDWGAAIPEGASASILPAAGDKDDGDNSTDSDAGGAGNAAATLTPLARSRSSYSAVAAHPTSPPQPTACATHSPTPPPPLIPFPLRP